MKTESSSFSRSLRVVHTMRIGIFTLLLFILTVEQLKQKFFLASEVLFPSYLLLAIQFAVSLWSLLKTESSGVWAKRALAVAFVVDIFIISGFIYFSRWNTGVFFLLYLMNIMLAGLAFQRIGAYRIALLSAGAFSLLLPLGPEIKGSSLFVALTINYFSFFAVAFLSGYLSEQIQFMDSEISFGSKKIRSLEETQQLIISQMPTGLITLSNTGDIEFCNPAGKEILGGSVLPQEIIDWAISKQDEQKLVEKLVEKLIEQKDFDLPFGNGKKTLSIKKSLGFEAVKETVKDATKNERNIILQFEDVTRMRTMQLQLQQQEKLAAVGQLAAGIAHEIRNPLASMSGSIEMLKGMWKESAGDEATLMNIVLKETDRLNQLISEFLDFVKPENNLEQNVDLSHLLKECAGLASKDSKINAKINWQLSIDENLKIKGNGDKLRQVFLNLFLNACQAMEKTEAPVLQVLAYATNLGVEVRVKDNGLGMSEEVRKRIFEPFFTTKPKGTGLGLAMVHKILQAHEVDIQVESRLGQGTEFRLRFTR